MMLRWEEPMPRGGLAERIYCTLRARDGYWSSDFLGIVQRCYRGRIPPRFEELVRRLERDRPWEQAEARRGDPYTITLVDRRGRARARFSSAEVA